MIDVLNLVPKKDIFEGIMNKSVNEIPIDATPYWRKRLIDQSTNNFKDFKIVRLSCGTPEKFDFIIDEFDLRDDKIIVKILFDEEKEEDAKETPVEEVKDIKVIGKEVYVSPKMDVKAPAVSVKPVEKKESLKTRVNNIIKEYVGRKNVFVVPTETVTIRTNGQIVGTTKRLVVDKDLDTTFELGTDEVVMYDGMSDDDFLGCLKAKLNKYYGGNYVFVCLKKSGWTKWASGEPSIKLWIACRKTYLMGRR